MGISEVLSLLGGVALFLFGMSLMGDSLKKVAGSKLEVVLYRLSGTQLKGILLGTGVTAVIQSSSATSVMVVGFVNSEMMKVRQAIGVIMGAIIGTSVTGWIICLSDIGGSSSGWLELLSTETLTSIVALIGIILYMFSSDMSNRHVGGILMGFAVNMSIVTRCNLITMQHFQYLIIIGTGVDRRIVQKHNGLQLLRQCRLNGDLQPLHLSSQHFGISRFSIHTHPASCAANAVLFKCVVVIMQNMQTFKAIIRKKLLHFPHGIPPIIVISLENDFLSRQGFQKCEIGFCLL